MLGLGKYGCLRLKLSHKLEITGPINRGNTIISIYFTFHFYLAISLYDEIKLILCLWKVP